MKQVLRGPVIFIGILSNKNAILPVNTAECLQTFSPWNQQQQMQHPIMSTDKRILIAVILLVYE